ncbi:hypothetical protein MNBD_IGNAVI01-3165 [hydrothermal vent metagenome]|uniref:Secretion system C-terminal sorting domain-containing protein n=1 Tax=hydrothermal vent metagenome TaxID=652676 RepID=A0A3B1BUL7_9ZZZZ
MLDYFRQVQLNKLYPENSTESIFGPGGTKYIIFEGTQDVLKIHFNGENGNSWVVSIIEEKSQNNSVIQQMALDNNYDGDGYAMLNDSEKIIFVPVIGYDEASDSFEYISTIAASSDVFFKNKTETLPLGGKLLVDYLHEIPSNSSLPLALEPEHSVKTLDERFIDPFSESGTPTYKHHDWNEVLSEFLQSQWFYVFGSNDDQEANFQELKHATININIDGIPISGQGELYFHDPWYLKSDGTQPDDYLPFTSPYEPNGKEGASEKGVFVNQIIQPNLPYYSIKVAEEQNITYNGNKTLYFQNWSSTDDNVVEPNSSAGGFYETPVIFKNEDDTINANYKGTQFSNNSIAFTHNNQRKIVKTDNGNLHMVYESMGKVWYERSTDDGDTWTIMNNGAPLSSGEAKLPSISAKRGFNELLVVYQKRNGNNYDIILECLGDLPRTTQTIHQEQADLYSNNVYPSVSFGSSGHTIILWAKNVNDPLVISGLFYWNGYINGKGITTFTTGKVPNTDYNSIKPSIVSNNNSEKHLVWQQNSSSGSSIKYIKMKLNTTNGIDFSNYSEPSANGGEDINFNPSIAITNNQSRVVWLTDTGNHVEGNLSTNFFSTVWSYAPTVFSNGSHIDIESIVVNSLNTTSGYVAAYSGDGKRVRYYKDDGTNTYVQPLIYDRFVQLSNGDNYTDMVVESFNTASLPYAFSSSIVDATLQKTSSDDNIIKGRRIILSEGNSKLMFEVNNIIVDNEAVDFIEVEDTLVTKSREETISLFETNDFLLTNNSSFEFDLAYRLRGKEKLAEQFDLELQLVDQKAKKTIGVLEKIETSKIESEETTSLKFGINTEGIVNKRVKLKLVVKSNAAEKISIANTYTASESLPKENSKLVSYDNTLEITDYSLSQNYPNPFNPSTVINYQIPEDGFVNLKIYDITGREITTLVNRSQTKGRYQVNFDASNLSSAVYFYRIQSVPSSGSGQGFLKTMKMILLH